MDDYQEELLELSALEQGVVDGDEDATELYGPVQSALRSSMVRSG